MIRITKTVLSALGALVVALAFFMLSNDVQVVSAGGSNQTFPITVLDGPSSFAKRISSGVWMFRDSSQLIHIRVTNSIDYCPPNGRVYTGSLKSDGPITNVTALKNDKKDSVTLSSGKTLTFTFYTHCQVDGVDFMFGGHNMTVTSKVGGASASSITSLGSNPFGFVQSSSFVLTQ